MRETVGDWRKDWIEANGETHDLEVVISDNTLDDFDSCVFEGAFANIPDNLLGKKVNKVWQIIDSSIPERIGAYSLVI